MPVSDFLYLFNTKNIRIHTITDDRKIRVQELDLTTQVNNIEAVLLHAINSKVYIMRLF